MSDRSFDCRAWRRWAARSAAVSLLLAIAFASDLCPARALQAEAAVQQAVSPQPPPMTQQAFSVVPARTDSPSGGCGIVEYMYAVCAPPRRMTYMILWRLPSGMYVYGQHRPTDDNCSKSPDTPLPGVAFWKVCQMHDYGMQLIRERYFADVRGALKTADRAFYDALRNGVCSTISSRDPRRAACYAVAATYYAAVSRVHAITGRP